MRALCGAIITAGGLIGLGLTAIGYGLRFQAFGPGVNHPESHQLYGIPTLVLILVILVISSLVGTGIAFLGLLYHHERRFLEQERERRSASLPAETPL
jgi:hypothetical protein